eukprot:2752076-Ditylum_brightwellii.AAC.1
MGGDRFIPNQAAMDLELAAHSLHSCGSEEAGGVAADNVQNGGSIILEADKDDYNHALGANILVSLSSSLSHCILSFKEKAPAPHGDTVNKLNILYSTKSMNRQRKTSKLVSQHIPLALSRILDALDLLSWSNTNTLAFVLLQTV